MLKRTIAIGLLAWQLTACSEEQQSPTMAEVSLEVGRQVYEQNCASCHGANGEGGENWRQRKPDGKFPPPPLNGTGHTWHHPLAILRYVIKNGSPGGQGDMPAWKDKLSDQQVDSVIAYVQSWWSPQVYTAWREIDQRARESAAKKQH